LAEFAEIRQIWLGLKFAIRLISAEFNEKSTEFGPNIRIHSGPIFLSVEFLNAGLVCIYMRDLLMYLLLSKVKKNQSFPCLFSKSLMGVLCDTLFSQNQPPPLGVALTHTHDPPPTHTPPPLLVAVVAYHFWWSSVAISYCVQGSSHVPSYLNHLRWWVAPRYPYPPLSLTTHH
jgi:hypothetical protein